MCDNKGHSKVCKFHVEDIIINLRKSGATPVEARREKFNLHDHRVPAGRIFLPGASVRDRFIKSKSDSDLYLSNDYKNLSKSKDSEVSSFPSDSDITVIRVIKKSRVQGIPSRAIEGILGDGSHVPESQSMINLATLVRQGVSPVFFTEERLIAVSSWDNSPIIRTKSDTKVRQSNASQVAAACSWVDGHRFSQLRLEARSSTSVDDRFFPKNIVAGLSELIQSQHNNNRDVNNDQLIGNKSIDQEIIIRNTDTADDKTFKNSTDKSLTNTPRNEKILGRFFARIRNTFRRALQCSCFFGDTRSPNIDEDKLDQFCQDL